jgi:hypothetical protein
MAVMCGFAEVRGRYRRTSYHIEETNMPKQSVKIIEATEKRIVLEGIFGNDGRLAVPKAARSLIEAKDKVRVTIDKL